ncbi:hypothetical protein [Variovorax saccharolyticus]|uniref:hypothetical protein n=1 Tax=Variovorax saccharolyticus TaxID=3053516 RepID=UPI002578EB2A|nr:hypothetical protein [Variovorax sp. J31P216]MDM0024781.1 hypothetical protein [Variovorax sp. J31P216]
MTDATGLSASLRGCAFFDPAAGFALEALADWVARCGLDDGVPREASVRAAELAAEAAAGAALFGGGEVDVAHPISNEPAIAQARPDAARWMNVLD